MQKYENDTRNYVENFLESKCKMWMECSNLCANDFRMMRDEWWRCTKSWNN